MELNRNAWINLTIAILFGTVFIFGLGYMVIFLNIANEEVIRKYNLWIQFVFMFIPLSAALFTFTLTQFANQLDKIEEWRRHVQSQKQLLKTLDVFRLQVHSAMQGHIQELSKKPSSIPSYFIPTFDALYMASKIDSKINGKNTTIFKQLLLKMQIKIDTINRLVELSQKAYVLKNHQETTALISELKKDDEYYEDLKKMIDEPIWQDWLKFLSHRSLNR